MSFTTKNLAFRELRFGSADWSKFKSRSRIQKAFVRLYPDAFQSSLKVSKVGPNCTEEFQDAKSCLGKRQ